MISLRSIPLVGVLIGSLVGCSTTTKPPSGTYEAVPLADLIERPARYHDKLIQVDGYVLGMEFREHSSGLTIWVMALGDTPAPSTASGEQLVFPTISRKIRVLEDGYNREVMRRCSIACSAARNRGEPVRIFGTFKPNDTFRHYTAGIDVHLSAVEVGGARINPDFDDRSALQAQTPGVLKRLYKSSKKVVDVVGGAL